MSTETLDSKTAKMSLCHHPNGSKNKQWEKNRSRRENEKEAKILAREWGRVRGECRDKENKIELSPSNEHV